MPRLSRVREYFITIVGKSPLEDFNITIADRTGNDANNTVLVTGLGEGGTGSTISLGSRTPGMQQWELAEGRGTYSAVYGVATGAAMLMVAKSPKTTVKTVENCILRWVWLWVGKICKSAWEVWEWVEMKVSAWIRVWYIYAFWWKEC